MEVEYGVLPYLKSRTLIGIHVRENYWVEHPMARNPLLAHPCLIAWSYPKVQRKMMVLGQWIGTITILGQSLNCSLFARGISVVCIVQQQPGIP
jgi:hypothetical protein